MKRRLELGLFQRQVAEILDVDQCTVTNWEKNHTQPEIHLIPRIMEFLGYSFSVGEARTLGEKLLKYRKTYGVSQKDLAGRIGIDQATLGRMERNSGRCKNTTSRLVKSFLEEISEPGEI